MTIREQIETILEKYDLSNGAYSTVGLAGRLEQVIAAAVEEKGARIAELESAITHSRQADEDAWLGRKIKAAVEAEREACARLAEDEGAVFMCDSPGDAAVFIGERIRARSTASSNSQMEVTK